ncbi:MAG: MurR/RpiR family transcriptional regulator [Anaerolineae bacterium]|nr:MurR/RpiR family transcriptional regulator [Anaerolineae bacterium]
MFQDRIRAHYDDLTPGFRKLADFIMNSTLDVAFLTATELSRRVGVDPATVVRFAQELGYSGFRELSREIKHYVRDQVTETYRKAGESGSTESLLNALLDNANQNLKFFITTDIAKVVSAVVMLREASHIWITGEYSGFEAAAYIAKKFIMSGKSAAAFQPSMTEIATVATRMEDGDVLLTIAGTEPSVDAGYAVQIARRKGLHTVTVAGSGVILPARESELTVIVPSKSPAGVLAFGTLMQVLSLIWEAVVMEQIESGILTGELHKTMEQLLKKRAETPEYEVSSLQDLWSQYNHKG